METLPIDVKSTGTISINVWIFQASFIDESAELNWLKLICTACGLMVGNEQQRYGVFLA